MNGVRVFTSVVFVLVTVAGAAQDLPELFERVDPAVVEILAERSELQRQGPPQYVKSGSLGSGFLIDADGTIMTAAHVVQTADRVAVRFVNGEVIPARITSSDPASDVALVVAERVPDGITPVVLADSDSARVGDQVFVIGAPYGISHSLTVGHVSARRVTPKVLSSVTPAELLQTDAAISTGNSGGPMFNMAGEVIGVVSHIISSSGGFEGLGFVVTSNLAREVLLDRRTMWSGMEAQLVSGELAAALNVPQEAGILVQGVAAGSPASTLGLQAGTLRAVVEGSEIVLGGDVILEVQGISVAAPEARMRIAEALEALQPSDIITVTVLRGGQRIDLRKAGYLL